MLKQIIVAPAEGARLHVASPTQCQSLNQSWNSVRVSEEGTEERAVDLGGERHKGTQRPSLRARAQSSEEGVQFADVSGFKRKVMFWSKTSCLL